MALRRAPALRPGAEEAQPLRVLLPGAEVRLRGAFPEVPRPWARPTLVPPVVAPLQGRVPPLVPRAPARQAGRSLSMPLQRRRVQR